MINDCHEQPDNLFVICDRLPSHPRAVAILLVTENSLNPFFAQGQGRCGGFLASMFISHLLSVKKINKHMSSYQILRVFLQFLGKQSTCDFSLQHHALSRRQVTRIKRIINCSFKHGLHCSWKSLNTPGIFNKMFISGPGNFLESSLFFHLPLENLWSFKQMKILS